jgi:hypothetical protein
MSEGAHLLRTLVSLAVTLAAGAALLFSAPTQSGPPPAVPLAAAWPNAQRGSTPAQLPDGSDYSPGLFLDSRTSVGTAQTPDGRFLTLLIREADGTLRQLRREPSAGRAPFAGLTTSGDTLIWVESVKGQKQLWTADLQEKTPARMITADLGALRLYDSQYDLAIAEGDVHWAAAAGDSTEFRSVALIGGPVSVQREAGDWSLSAWPWAMNGHTATSGTTTLRNLTTGQNIAVPAAKLTVNACSPTWCQMVSLNDEGYTRIELSHPDGSARRIIAEGAVATAISDVAVLDRFALVARTGPQSELSGNQELLIYDLSDRRTVLVSPDAGNISYRGGVLWWSTGDRSSFARNSLDLRTV